MICVLNLASFCLQLETKFSIALSPISCVILVYKPITSKITKTVSSVTFGLYVFKNPILSLMLLLTYLVKGFKIISEKLLNLLVVHFGLPSTGLSFKSLGYEMVISSLFCSLITLYANFPICLFQGGHKSYLFQNNCDPDIYILNL